MRHAQPHRTLTVRPQTLRKRNGEPPEEAPTRPRQADHLVQAAAAAKASQYGAGKPVGLHYLPAPENQQRPVHLLQKQKSKPGSELGRHDLGLAYSSKPELSAGFHSK